MICIGPQAPVDEVTFVWKPDSCHASARARLTGDAVVRRPLVDVGADGRAAQLLGRAGRDRSRQPQLRPLQDEVLRLDPVRLRERPHGRLVLRGDRGQRVPRLDDVGDRRGDGDGVTAAATGPRRPYPNEVSVAGPAIPSTASPASAGSAAAPPWSRRRSGRRRRRAADARRARAGTGARRRPTRTCPGRGRAARRADARARRAPPAFEAPAPPSPAGRRRAGTRAAPSPSSGRPARRSCRSTSPSRAATPAGLRSRGRGRRPRGPAARPRGQPGRRR